MDTTMKITCTITRCLQSVLSRSPVIVGLLAALCLSLAAFAHPADEFCTPNSGMDPELCRALAELDRSEPITTDALLVDVNRTILSNTLYFVEQGVRHILPGGTDHILFVLALFFAVRKLRPLLIQISIFTLAHSATLGLAAAGLVNLPGNIVEPLIAASIAFVAIENLFFKTMTKWRPFIVFAFGLFHGLGFAGFFLEQKLPEGFFWSSLVGFNIGVEIGQIAVVTLAFFLLRWFFDKSWYFPAVVVPASLAIAGFGGWWAIERVFF